MLCRVRGGGDVGVARLTMTVVADTPDGLVVIVGDALPYGRQGMSIYGAERSQPVATGGKCRGARNRENKQKPLP